MRELVVDLFSGGGGASTGIELGLGRSPDIAVNHDDEAVTMHMANHPRTQHLCGDVWEWASPDCKHFSKAKGGQPPEVSKHRMHYACIPLRDPAPNSAGGFNAGGPPRPEEP